MKKTSTQAQVELQNTDSGFAVRVAASRPPSLIGGQGVHTLAYVLFKKCIEASIQKLANIEDVPKHVLAIIDTYVSNKEATILFEKYKEELKISKLVSASQLEEVQNCLSRGNVSQELEDTTIFAIKNSNTSIIKSLIQQLIEHHLTLRNKIELVTFPVEGNVMPASGEGARVKNAIKYLAELPSASSSDSRDVKTIVSNIKELFWYPKIPSTVLIDLNTNEGREEWSKYSEKYTKGTKPRDNSIEKLQKAILNHLELMFLCFEDLEEKSRKL